MIWKVIKSPYLHLLSGVILLITSAVEIFQKIGDDSLGSHHGLFVFSLIQIIRTIPEFHDAAEKISESLDD